MEQADNYQILYLRNNSIYVQTDHRQEQIVQEPYVMIYEDGGSRLRLGNTVQVMGELCFFEEERNPGGFSQKDYYQVKRIAAYLWSSQVQRLDGRVFLLRDLLYRFRLQWEKQLMETAGEEEGGVLCAILLGNKKEINDNIKQIYQMGGLSHILAISGLHLSFVGLGFYRMLRRLTGSYALGGAFGMAFLLLYIIMIGSSVSAVRALIMFCIRVGADMSGRVYDAPTAVAAAAAGVILWRPFSFYDAGFQLSFGAVCGIIFLYPLVSEEEAGYRNSAVKEKRNTRSSLLSGIKDSFTASICIQAATLPAILFHYYEFPVYSVLLNLIVIPLMSLLLVSGFAGSFLCLFWPGGGILCMQLCGLILKLYERLCRGICLLPKHQLITGKPEVFGIIVYCTGLLLCLLLLHGKICRAARAGAYTVGMLALIFSCPAVNHKGLEAVFLDVGQGDGIFIRERGGITCLIDGGSSDVSKVGKYRIEPFLKARGVSEIDYAFVTHGDSDHISGLEELLERQDIGVRISCVVFPEQELWDEKLESLCLLAREYGTRTAVMHPGQRLEGKKLILGCIAPDGEKLAETGNAASLVLEGTYGELDILFTGDVEGEGENLLTEILEKEYEVLKVAHHGSKNSTNEKFLEIVHPKLAVISAGRDNRYGHPHEETLVKLEKEGAAVLITAQSGAVILKAKGKDAADLKITQYNSDF
ncbi:MAG: DNA internalization-related competence protein ComEC/Rec2 [Dorea sp.]|jgi:DNA internalization-related competence protein ComEC/Rec2|nr:DNA internalization-related competence protein ComEC/Rec2 [Dorea sp.]